MADEQIIYLSPEEELTNVRERLERTRSRRIILVIPAQTQLRSHVSWRLLHSRACELNKDVLIISADRQIRTVVKAAGFKIAGSLESPLTSRPRSANRPGRPGLGGRTSPRLHAPTSKSASEQPAGQQSLHLSEPGLISEPVDRPYRREDDSILKSRQAQPAETFEDDEQSQFDYRIDSSSGHLHTVNQPFEDEEPNHVYDDYRKSQSIRQTAQMGDADTMLPPPPPLEARTPMRDQPYSSIEPDDPLTYLDDTVHLHLPEQRGSAFTHDVEEQVSDISEQPGDAMQIEDQGDMGDIVDRSASSSGIAAVPGEEEHAPDAASVHGRPRAKRRRSAVPPQVSEPDPDDEMALPPVLEQGPAPVQLPRPRPRPQGRSTQPGVKRRSGAGTVNALRPPLRAAGRPQPAPLGSSKYSAARLIVPGLILLALLALVSLVILLPSADVTVVLPAHTYSLPLTLTAKTSSRQGSVQHTLPAQMLVYDMSVQGTGKATGVTTVGTVAAAGSVYFTNNNSSAQGQVDIPTGTQLATQNHVLFATQADVLVQPGQTLPTTIVAQNTGVIGNVAAHAITVLPTEGISKIRQANPGVAINLKVDNASPTTHGGTGTASQVTSQDVASEKNTLDIQVNAQIQGYLRQNVHNGDQQGTLIREESPTVTPPQGSVATSNTFLETLKVHMTVLVVRASDLQAVVRAELKNVLIKQGSGLALVPQQEVQLRQLKNTPARDGSSLVLSFTAVGQVAAQISADTVRNLMAGKTIDYARNVLDGKNSTPNALRTEISVQNGVLHFMPFLAQRITVHFLATAAPPQ